jgi:hypothetical protein
LNTTALSEMAMTLRMEDRLQGAQNFATWKERVTMILDVNDVLDHVDSKAVAPTDATLLVAWKKGEAKAKSILLDGVKDHIIPHLTKKTCLLRICGRPSMIFTRARMKTG